MRNNQVYARLRHLDAFLWSANIAGRIEANVSSRCDHFNFTGEAQSNRLEVTANVAVEPTYGGVIDHPGKPGLPQLDKKLAHIPRRIGTAHSSQNGGFLCGRKDMVLAKFQHDFVSIPVRHQACLLYTSDAADEEDR